MSAAIATVLLVAMIPRPGVACAQQSETPPSDRALAEFAQPLDPAEAGIGECVPDLAFTDLDGRAGRLSDYRDRKALVLVIRDVGCPVSRKYGLRTAEIERAFAPRGVAFLYVNTSEHDSVEKCHEEVKEYGFSGRYARDPEGRFGWHLKARTTTDVFVLDPERRLRYRGAIDDQIGRGATRPAPTREYAKDALEAILRGERVADPAMTAPGCTLRTFTPPSDEPASPAQSPLVWFGRVERIVQDKCQRCHHSGGAAPFELLTPLDVSGRAAMVAQVVGDGVMPPWYATKSSGPFKDDMSLSDEQKKDLLAWLEAGGPPGDPKDAAPARSWPGGWLIGQPDLIVEIPAAIDVPATGVVDYLNVTSPTNLDRDVWVQAMQILCENPGVCHHVLVHALHPESKTQDFLDSYLPGKAPTLYREGMAALLEKGTVLRFNLHYTPNGKPVKERTKIGFKFATTPPKERVRGKIVRLWDILIPPGEPGWSGTVEHRMRFDAELRRLIPHMHLRGKAAKVELLFPDGSSRVVLDLPRWHPDWQYAYELVEPIPMPAGTVIRSISVYDNSKSNPFNPNARATVTQGPQIWDEMGGVFVEWTRPVTAPREPREPADEKDDGGR